MPDSQHTTPAGREHVACPLCGGDAPRDPFEAKELLYGTGETFTVVRCGNCGVMYTNPRPTAAAIADYYPEDYYGLDRGDRIRKHAADATVPLKERLVRTALGPHFGYPHAPRGPGRWLLTLPIAARLRRDRRLGMVLPWAGKGRLLDFGCGRGGFLRVQRARGWQVAGIDISQDTVKHIRDDDGIDAEAGTWPGPAMRGRQFDVITAWHVLEHLPDPPAWVREAVARLAPGGYLIVCCPVHDSWGYRWFGKNWFGLDLPRHFTHFTTRHLVKLLTDAGLVVENTYPQVRTQPLHHSARRHADQTGAVMWRLAAKQKWLWTILARLSALFGQCDVRTVMARKVEAKHEAVENANGQHRDG